MEEFAPRPQWTHSYAVGVAFSGSSCASCNACASSTARSSDVMWANASISRVRPAALQAWENGRDGIVLAHALSRFWES